MEQNLSLLVLGGDVCVVVVWECVTVNSKALRASTQGGSTANTENPHNPQYRLLRVYLYNALLKYEVFVCVFVDLSGSLVLLVDIQIAPKFPNSQSHLLLQC